MLVLLSPIQSVNAETIVGSTGAGPTYSLSPIRPQGTYLQPGPIKRLLRTVEAERCISRNHTKAGSGQTVVSHGLP